MSAETQIAQPPAPAINARVTAPLTPTAPIPTVQQSASAPAAGEPTAAPVEPAAAPLGFQLEIDPETQRLIIEARDPVTGFVIFQSPPQTAFTATNAAGSATVRGKTVDRDI